MAVQVGQQWGVGTVIGTVDEIRDGIARLKDGSNAVYTMHLDDDGNPLNEYWTLRNERPGVVTVVGGSTPAEDPVWYESDGLGADEDQEPKRRTNIVPGQVWYDSDAEAFWKVEYVEDEEVFVSEFEGLETDVHDLDAFEEDVRDGTLTLWVDLDRLARVDQRDRDKQTIRELKCELNDYRQRADRLVREQERSRKAAEQAVLDCNYERECKEAFRAKLDTIRQQAEMAAVLALSPGLLGRAVRALVSLVRVQ